MDVFDALTTDRPYRKALSQDMAFSIMHEEVERGWWDGQLVDAFEEIVRQGMPEFPFLPLPHKALPRSFWQSEGAKLAV